MASNHGGLLDKIASHAFLDELNKIAEATKPKNEGVGKALKAMGVGALGTALGYGGAELLSRKLDFFNRVPSSPEVLDRRIRAAKIILPILSGAAVMLGERYRNKMNEQHSSISGYQPKENGK